MIISPIVESKSIGVEGYRVRYDPWSVINVYSNAVWFISQYYVGVVRDWEQGLIIIGWLTLIRIDSEFKLEPIRINFISFRYAR